MTVGERARALAANPHALWIAGTALAIVLAVVFINDIGRWFGMRSKAAFERAVMDKDKDIAAKEEVSKAAELRAKDAEKTAAVAEQRATDKAVQLAKVNSQLDAIIKARPNVTEVIRADEKLAATDQGICELIERVLHVPCARVRMAKSCGS